MERLLLNEIEGTFCQLYNHDHGENKLQANDEDGDDEDERQVLKVILNHSVSASHSSHVAV